MPVTRTRTRAADGVGGMFWFDDQGTMTSPVAKFVRLKSSIRRSKLNRTTAYRSLYPFPREKFSRRPSFSGSIPM